MFILLEGAFYTEAEKREQERLQRETAAWQEAIRKEVSNETFKSDKGNIRDLRCRKSCDRWRDHAGQQRNREKATSVEAFPGT